MPTATERMIAFHIARLKDKNPEVRLKSIRELELLNAVEAFSALEALYHNESDPAVKEAARKLGVKLFKQLRSRGSQQGGATTEAEP